jgi:hypothetical protein
MRTDRRTMLKGSLVTGSAALLGAAGPTMARAQLVIHDAGTTGSATFLARHPLARRIDVRVEHRSRWSALRSLGTGTGRIEGLTRWNDLVAVRGELESQGFRLAFERPIAGRDNLFHWAMIRPATGTSDA